ncbi:hypothetical protein P3S68_026944 [Capsicum galapagoense]
MPQPTEVPPTQLPELPEPADTMSIEQHQINGVTSLVQCDSFKDKLLNKACSINKYYDYKMGKRPIRANDDNATIDRSNEDKDRIYQPWQFSVIVKLFNKRLAHNYLRTKLQDTWKPTESKDFLLLKIPFMAII